MDSFITVHHLNINAIDIKTRFDWLLRSAGNAVYRVTLAPFSAERYPA